MTAGSTSTALPPAPHEHEARALRAHARRAALPVGLVVAAITVIAAVGGPLRALLDALHRALDADPRWLVAAAVLELLSFGGYIALMWLVGGRASPRLGLRASAEVTLGGAAATRLLPTGGAGGAAVALWAFRRAGLPTRDAARALLTVLVLVYSVFLVSIATAGAALALGIAHGNAPLVLTALPAALAALAIAAGLGVGVRRPAPAAESRSRSAGRARARDASLTLGAAVHEAIALVRSADVRLVGALVWWGFDGAVLWGMMQALGTPPSLAVIALGYFIGQVAGTLPIPGAVSGGMVGVLLAFGVEADLALASVLAYRAVAVWVPAPFGLAALGGLRLTVAKWGRADAPIGAGLPRPHRVRPAEGLEPAPQPA
jgi:putative heme transporter